MPRRKFVTEMKAENIKDINPNDIIYLALKDGSIVLIVDNDEDTIEYDDIKSEISSQKRSNINFYNNKLNINKRQKKTISSFSNTNDTENFNVKTKYSYNSKEKTKTSSSFYNERNKNKPIIISNKRQKENNNNYSRYNKDKDIMNQSYNSGRKEYNLEFNRTSPNFNYHSKKERLEKSFDNSNSKRSNHYIHKIECICNNSQKPKSTKSHYIENNNTTTNNLKFQKINVTPNDVRRTPSKRGNRRFVYDNNNINNNHQLINISDISINADDNSYMNKTQHIENRGFYQNYFNTNNLSTRSNNINLFNRSHPIRSQSFNNRNTQTPQTYVVKRKEMEIMGRIVNDDNSYRLIDHRHPNTLYEPKCPYCQNLARNNKLCISNIKEESIYDNHSFVASFGGSGSKRGKSQNNFYKAI